jgi:hypothetical protein
MRPTVVHLKRKGGRIVVDCDVYIGRAMHQGGWRLPASKWANPFKPKDYGDGDAGRAQAIASYEAHVRARPELMAALPELRGKRLGCWCHPFPCHGDVLVRLLGELDAAQKGPAPRRPPVGPPPSVGDQDPLWTELGL